MENVLGLTYGETNFTFNPQQSFVYDTFLNVSNRGNFQEIENFFFNELTRRETHYHSIKACISNLILNRYQ